jgi:hypothetical protein
MKVKQGNLVWKLHEQRQKTQELAEMRRRIVEAAHAEQIARERQMLQSQLDRLVPPARKVYLKARLEKLMSHGN